MENLTLDWLKENFAYTKQGFGSCTMDIDEEQVKALTGKDFIIDGDVKRLVTDKPKALCFKTDGMNMKVSQLMDFFGDDNKQVRTKRLNYRTINGVVCEI